MAADAADFEEKGARLRHWTHLRCEGSEGSQGSEGKVLRMDRPRGRRVLKFDGAFGPEGCGGG